ncbi:MAG: Flp family type IVb pilin [Phyllobacteriaceae bacterium]|nr:Flp family type IVb pilin [Phyllobacteriaceae bacterium]
MFRIFLTDARGATAIEYALIAALLSIATVAGVTAVGTDLQTLYDSNNGSIGSALSGAIDG